MIILSTTTPMIKGLILQKVLILQLVHAIETSEYFLYAMQNISSGLAMTVTVYQ